MLTPMFSMNPLADTEVLSYRSAAEFRRLWSHLDQADAYLKISIVVAFNDQFPLSITDAIQRQNRGLQLTIVTESHRLPGLVSRVDLELYCISLGWQCIQFSTNWEESLERHLENATTEDRQIVLLPSFWGHV